MKDITEQIKKAININILWSIDKFYLFLEKLKQDGLQVSHWEHEEFWATISIENTKIGFLWQKYPLIFISKEKIGTIMNVIEEFNYIVLIAVNDLESQELIIRSEQYIIDRIGFTNFDKPTSALDIWFDTIN